MPYCIVIDVCIKNMSTLLAVTCCCCCCGCLWLFVVFVVVTPSHFYSLPHSHQALNEAELRRRDADMRNFASAASLQQERCGQRLREQALTIHQLTLQGFSAEAEAASTNTATAAVAASSAGRGGVGGGIGRDAATSSGAGHTSGVGPIANAPRRRWAREEEGGGGGGGGRGTLKGSGGSLRAGAGDPRTLAASGDGRDTFDCPSRGPVGRVSHGVAGNEGGWGGGHSLDSGFPASRPAADAAATARDGRYYCDVSGSSSSRRLEVVGGWRRPGTGEGEAIMHSSWPGSGFGSSGPTGIGSGAGRGRRRRIPRPLYPESASPPRSFKRDV